MKDILSKCTLSENEVGNMCQYRCMGCHGVFSSWERLNYHLKSTNHGPLGMENLGKYIEKYVSHKCKLCSKVLLNDYINLISHFRIHKIETLRVYCNKTGCMIVNVRGSKKFQQMIDKKSKSSTFSKSWGNRCTYACNICGEMSKSWFQLQKHLMAKKHYKLKKLAKKYLQHEELFIHAINLVFHKCALCSKNIPCDEYFLGRHFSRQHRGKMTAKQYKSNIDHLSVEEALKDIPTSEPLMVPTMTADRMPAATTTPHVGDLCRFACFMCPMYTMSEWSSFKHEHLVRHHQLSDFEADYCVEARYHKCLLCQTVILNDRYFIQNHLTRKHRGRTPSSYYELVEEGGHSVLFRGNTNSGIPPRPWRVKKQLKKQRQSEAATSS